VSDYKPPSIPPIQNIADTATKNALLALTEGWQVRNGMTGSGGDQFITKDEFDLALKNMGVAAPVTAQDVPGSYAGGGGATASSVDLLPLHNWWTGRNTWNLPFPANTDADNWHIKLATAGLARWNFSLGHPVLTGTQSNIIPIGAWNSPSDTSDYMFVLNAARSAPAYAGHVALAFMPDSNSDGRGIVANGMLRVEGVKDKKTLVIGSDSPTNSSTENAHIIFRRDNAEKWKFRLGHTTAGNGNFYVVDATDIFATFNSMQNGGALSFLGRSSSYQINKTAIQLRDTMGIGWNVSDLQGVVPGTIKTYFDANLWTIDNDGYKRFSVDVRIAEIDCIRIVGSNRPTTYLSDNMTVNAVYANTGQVPGVGVGVWQKNLSAISRVPLQAIISDLASTLVDHAIVLSPEAKYGSLHAISWNANPANRYSLQQFIENIVTTSVDHGDSINNIRNLTGNFFTAGTKCALMTKLDSAISPVASNIKILQSGVEYKLQDVWNTHVQYTINYENYVNPRISALWSDGTMPATRVHLKQLGAGKSLQEWWDTHVQYTINLERVLVENGINMSL